MSLCTTLTEIADGLAVVCHENAYGISSAGCLAALHAVHASLRRVIDALEEARVAEEARVPGASRIDDLAPAAVTIPGAASPPEPSPAQGAPEAETTLPEEPQG